MRLLRLRLAAVALLLPPLLLPAAAARGQQEYRLGEDDRWTAEETAEPTAAEARLIRTRATLAAGRYERAEQLATDWIGRFPLDPLLPEAYLIRGDALSARRDYYKALFDYEFIARSYPGSDTFVTALQREFDIARMFAAGMKRKMWGMRIADASSEAEELLIRIQERLPGSHLAEQAGMALGDFYFRRRQMSLAADMYALFLENFPRSEYAGKARRRLIFAHLASFKGPEFDANGLYEARTRIETLKAVDPVTAQEMGADAILTRIEESDALKMLVTARWYLDTNDPIAAEMTIRRLIHKYPRSVAAGDALRQIPAILDRLPPQVVRSAPDYALLRAAILGAPPAAPEGAEDIPAEDAAPRAPEEGAHPPLPASSPPAPSGDSAPSPPAPSAAPPAPRSPEADRSP